mgnify:CR=1 FL=1
MTGPKAKRGAPGEGRLFSTLDEVLRIATKFEETGKGEQRMAAE